MTYKKVFPKSDAEIKQEAFERSEKKTFPQPMTDKQPQTCYIPVIYIDWGGSHKLINTGDNNYAHLNKLNSVYIHTPEELEALKAKWMREAAEKAWVQSDETAAERMDYRYGRHGGYKHPDKDEYLDQHYPLPQQ